MAERIPTDEQLGALYHRYAEAQAGTVAVVIKTICNQRGWSLVHLRNELGVGPADLRRLEKMPIPGVDSFVADIQIIIRNCSLQNWVAFIELLGGPLLLCCLRDSNIWCCELEEEAQKH